MSQFKEILDESISLQRRVFELENETAKAREQRDKLIRSAYSKSGLSVNSFSKFYALTRQQIDNILKNK